MNEPVGPRRYTEKEVGLILRRATQMQRAEPSAEDPAGLTLAELQDIAQEAGIDPELLRQAAHQVESHGVPTVGSRLAGAPMTIQLERVILGEYPVDNLDELIPIIQTATAGQGTASAVGGTLSWASRSDTNATAQQVLVTTKDGQTLVRIEESVGGLAGGLFGGIMGGVGGGVGLGAGGALAGVLGSVVLAFVFPAVVIGGSYALARSLFVAAVEKRRKSAEVLMEQLTSQIERRIGERTLAESDATRAREE